LQAWSFSEAMTYNLSEAYNFLKYAAFSIPIFGNIGNLNQQMPLTIFLGFYSYRSDFLDFFMTLGHI
jgi:hypothetical protein